MAVHGAVVVADRRIELHPDPGAGAMRDSIRSQHTGTHAQHTVTAHSHSTESNHPVAANGHSTQTEHTVTSHGHSTRHSAHGHSTAARGHSTRSPHTRSQHTRSQHTRSQHSSTCVNVGVDSRTDRHSTITAQGVPAVDAVAADKAHCPTVEKRHKKGTKKGENGRWGQQEKERTR